MLPSDPDIINNIIQKLAERDPAADPEELILRLNEPLEEIYRINSQIGIDIASELAEEYDLPELPRMKLKGRENYISIGGLLKHIKEQGKEVRLF